MIFQNNMFSIRDQHQQTWISLKIGHFTRLSNEYAVNLPIITHVLLSFHLTLTHQFFLSSLIASKCIFWWRHESVSNRITKGNIFCGFVRCKCEIKRPYFGRRLWNRLWLGQNPYLSFSSENRIREPVQNKNQSKVIEGFFFFFSPYMTVSLLNTS